MKTKLEIVLEELEFRKTHPICQTLLETGGLVCKYYHKGNMCAVGRCLSRPKAHKDKHMPARELFNISYEASRINPIVNSKKLKPEYRGHELSFWTDLQQQHDWGYTASNRLFSKFVKRFNLDEATLKSHGVKIVSY